MIGRAALAGGGVALALSLFVPWFDETSGWEHWRWVDVLFLALAAGLVASALLRPRVVPRTAMAVLCAVGIAVVLGHGFEPRAAPDDPLPGALIGPYLMLGALAAGVVGAVASWPRAASRLLLVAAAAAIVAGLLTGWGGERISGPLDDLGGSYELIRGASDGFARWKLLDVALLGLAAALLVLALPAVARTLGRRAATVAVAVVAAACVAAAVCIVVAGNLTVRGAPRTPAAGLALGPLLTLLGLAAGVAGLALRPRAPAGRAG